MKKSPRQNLRKPLAQVIRTARKSMQLTQEDFALISSRTYLSTLERGLKSPTIDKLEELANVMETTPAAMLLAAQLLANDCDADELIAKIATEAKLLTKKS